MLARKLASIDWIKFIQCIFLFLSYLRVQYKTLPNVAIGIFTVLAVFPYIFLPETMDTGIPETVEDMEKMDNTIAAKLCHQK